MTGELVRREDWEPRAKALVEQYAAFTDVDSLTTEEKILSLLSLVPMSLTVVEEARDSIERLNDENESLRAEVAELRWMRAGLEK